MKFNIIKKLSALLLVITLGVTLSACSDEKVNSTTPYGNITGNFATYNNVTLTNKTLYDMMRMQGNSLFINEVESIVLKPYLDKIDYTNENDLQDLQDIINSTLFGTDEIDDIFYLSSEDKDIKLQQVIDSLYVSNINITAADIKIESTGVTYSSEIMDFFKINLAKQRLAEEKLSTLVNEEEIQDPNGDEGDMIDNTYFISDEDIENYYNNTYVSKQDYNAVIIGFNSIAQYEQAMEGFDSNNVKTSFINLYNTAFPYKVQLNSSNFNEETIVNSDRLSAYNSSLSSFITSMDAGKYTLTYKEFGDKIYMIYKDTDLSDLKWNELSDSDEFTAADIEEIEKEIREELYDIKLTSSFISSQVTELINDLVDDNKIKIYDPLFSLQFASKYDYEDSNLTSTTNVATIDGVDISVDDFFDLLEENHSITVSLDYFLNVSMVGNFTLTDDEKEDAEDAYDAALDNFKDNGLASVGLTNSFSEQQFLSMQYGFTSKSDVLKYYFYPQEGIHYFYEDYNNLYFDLLESVGKYTYEQYFSLDIVHMLLFVDADMDGTLDNPEEFIRDLSDSNAIKFKETIVNIYAAVYAEADFLALGYEKSLNYIVNAYNENATLAHDSTKTWNDIKTSEGINFNIQMKVEDLGEVNNSNSSNYVESFSTHVKNTYFDLMDTIDDNEDFTDNFKELLEKENLEEITTSTTFDSLCMSSFGFHMLLSTGGKMATSAKFNKDNDYKTSSGLYAYEEIEIELDGEPKTVTGWSNNNWPSRDQLEVYISEMDGDDGVYSLKSSTETIIDASFATFKARFESEAFVAYLLITEYDLLNTIVFTNSNNKAKITETIEISKRSMDSYKSSADTVYADWWDILNESVK